MQLSREARLVAGITLLTIPTIMYGGITLLGILTTGTVGIAPAGPALDDTQWALFRAGHAHAGVWVVFYLVLQVVLDSAILPTGLKWLARISAPLAAVGISGGFFGIAFMPAFRWLLYSVLLAVAVILAGVGLLRRASGGSLIVQRRLLGFFLLHFGPEAWILGRITPALYSTERGISTPPFFAKEMHHGDRFRATMAESDGRGWPPCQATGPQDQATLSAAP